MRAPQNLPPSTVRPRRGQSLSSAAGLNSTFSATPGGCQFTGPRADQASITSSIRNSGAGAPAARPMVLAPRNILGSSAGIWPRPAFVQPVRIRAVLGPPGRSPRSISLVAHAAPLAMNLRRQRTCSIKDRQSKRGGFVLTAWTTACGRRHGPSSTPELFPGLGSAGHPLLMC